MSTSAMPDSPPYVAKETERMVLGACLSQDGLTAAFVNEGVRDLHFFSAHHRAIWRRLLEAQRGELGALLPTVYMLLAKHGEIEDVTPAYLSSLVSGMPPLRKDAIGALAGRLIECSVGRGTLAALRKALADLEQRPAALSEGFFGGLDASLRSLSAQLQGRRVPDHVAHVSEVMEEVLAGLRAGPQTFIDTPWPALNSMLGGGFAPGELVLLGARPGHGKTAGAIEIARRTAKRGGPVLVISREMLRQAVGLRMLAQEGPVNATTLRKRDFSPYHWETIDLAVEVLQSLPIFITHARVTIDDIRKLVALLAEESPLALLIVDYLQLIDAPAGVQERRFQVEAVSAGLKAITLDYQIPVLALSSLARPAQETQSPTLKSLRESGNLEHDADTVILLHRPEELEMLTKVIVPKSRNGRTGMVELFFRGEYLRFEEPAGASYGQ